VLVSGRIGAVLEVTAPEPLLAGALGTAGGPGQERRSDSTGTGSSAGQSQSAEGRPNRPPVCADWA
jgi:hypothetical protein